MRMGAAMCNAAGALLIVGAMAGAVAGYVAGVPLRRDRDDRLRQELERAAACTTDEVTRRRLRDILC